MDHFRDLVVSSAFGFCLTQQCRRFFKQHGIDRHGTAHFEAGPLRQSWEDLTLPEEILRILLATGNGIDREIEGRIAKGVVC